MLCHTWNNLFEQYERAALKRIERKKGHSFPIRAQELDRLNTDIATALRALKDHEKKHQCH